MTDGQPTSKDLLPRVARGEPGAVDDCLARYSPLVWSLAKRLCNDIGVIEDVVQEIFIELWKKADRFDPERASEATFIATIARRRVIDRRRRDSRAPEMADVAAVDPGAIDQDELDPGLAAIDVHDEARHAREVLAELRPEQQRVILMSVVEGHTHNEIATVTGLPLGTVKSHIRRGLDRVAQKLRATRGEGES